MTLSPNPFRSLGNKTFFIEGEKQSDKKLYLIFDVDQTNRENAGCFWNTIYERNENLIMGRRNIFFFIRAWTTKNYLIGSLYTLDKL